MFVKFLVKRRTLPLTQINAYSVSIGERKRRECARNPRSVGLADSLPTEERAQAARRYVEHLDRSVEASPFDVEDRRMSLQQDRQGIGLSRCPIDIA